MDKKKKKWYSIDNIITAVLGIFVLLMIINPAVKSTAIQGLMKIGLFQPKIAKENIGIQTKSNYDYSVNFTSADGNIISGESLKNKVVFINFWATWCPPCIAEMPSINELYHWFKNNPDIIFLLVDADYDIQKSTAFMQTKNFDLPVVTSKSSIPSEWYSGKLPTTVVLDKKGNVAYKQTGAAEYTNKKFINFISELINQK